MDNWGYTIKEVENTDIEVMKKIGRLRYEVWLDLLDTSLFPEKTWLEDMDYGEKARHWVAKLGDEVVAAVGSQTQKTGSDKRK